MAQYNPNDYEMVADRLPRFLKDHPDARIITKNLTTPADRDSLTWVVQTEIYLPMYEIFADWVTQPVPEHNWFLKATGLAFEIDGQGGQANRTSALENCETSSIGRALANCGYGGDKRASREEMEKVQRGVTPTKDWLALAAQATTKDELRSLYTNARKAGANAADLAQIAEVADKWTQSSAKS